MESSKVISYSSNLLSYDVLTFEHLLFLTFVILSLIVLFFKKLRDLIIFNINIKKFIMIVISFEFLIIFYILFELTTLDKIENNLAKVYSNKFEMISLADKLRQSSDDLTHYARTYVITNNSKYKDIYYEILDIRNGKKDRPEFYETIYWDINKSLREKRHPFKKKISLKNLIKKLPYTKKELDSLYLSEYNSNDLVNLELEAFTSMNNDQNYAVKILHSEKYYKAKEKIMLPIDDMIINLYNRTNLEINYLQEKIRIEFIYIFFVVTYFIFTNILIYFIMIRKVGKPIAYLTDVILKFKSGNKNIKQTNFYDDEIGYMNNQFFYMKDVILEQQNSLNLVNKNLEIRVAKKTIEIRKFNDQLQQKVYERTEELEESNEELQMMIHNLKQTQDKLIDAEKMASLGGLVAGVAHEINTPVGIGLTGITYFSEITKNIKNSYQNDNISEDEFKDYLNTSEELALLITSNLKRTADLVSSFKQVAVDQTSEEKRKFNLKNYINDTIFSLSNIIKKTKLDIKINCNDDIVLDSYPGAFSQIITNLIINSIRHGFKEGEKGNILLDIKQSNNELTIIYKDDGCGIKKENQNKIFDPFFTTNREKGGTGLGLNIIYNIVNIKLNGTITCNSKESEGVEFVINITSL